MSFDEKNPCWIQIDSFDFECLLGDFLVRNSVFEKVFEILFIFFNVILILMKSSPVQNILRVARIDIGFVHYYVLLIVSTIVTIRKWISANFGLGDAHNYLLNLYLPY